MQLPTIPVPSTRAQVITRRSYNRPTNEAGTTFETWEETVARVIEHQQWLWERARGKALGKPQLKELEELRGVMLRREGCVSGRTLWLGGTDIAKRRESSQFNCSFSATSTIHSVVDHFWLLLQGCGVGNMGDPGVLNGFTIPAEEVRVIPSAITLEDWHGGYRGDEHNKERYYKKGGKRVWQLTVGDSAEAWAKSVGKILAIKKPIDVVVLDFSQVRPSGIRLKGYGWISSGHEPLAKSLTAICHILTRKAGQLLDRIDLLDVENWLGTTLSSRRSAEIILCPYGDPEWETFASAKESFWVDNMHRAQSNNSLVFFNRPSVEELKGIFERMIAAGGSEPGFINRAAATKRAPWFKGVNPCVEILLPDAGFCNLVEINTSKFNGRFDALLATIRLLARANYRQTCVQLKDEMLQECWHEINEFLRLCGVGLTGLIGWEHQDDSILLNAAKEVAHRGVHSMADELGLPRSKCVTTIKPSGTLSKIMDCTEGAHKPLGKYIFNNVVFGNHDPLIPILREAGYRMFPHPSGSPDTVITLPVMYNDVEFSEVVLADGTVVEVNLESAITQLERYKLLMENYVDHNCSITVSYDVDEVSGIVDWIYQNWDMYVGVSFLFRNDPTKTAADLGYPYLPQTCVTKEAYDCYVAELAPVDLSNAVGPASDMEADCAGGACPIR